MELKEARKQAEKWERIIKNGSHGHCLGTYYAAITLNNRITELEAQRDELIEVAWRNGFAIALNARRADDITKYKNYWLHKHMKAL